MKSKCWSVSPCSDSSCVMASDLVSTTTRSRPRFLYSTASGREGAFSSQGERSCRGN